ncbi:MAG: hypothetical protein AABY30_05465 [Candidatus Thermoplasmatota archaeon]
MDRGKAFHAAEESVEEDGGVREEGEEAGLEGAARDRFARRPRTVDGDAGGNVGNPVRGDDAPRGVKDLDAFGKDADGNALPDERGGDGIERTVDAHGPVGGHLADLGSGDGGRRNLRKADENLPFFEEGLGGDALRGGMDADVRDGVEPVPRLRPEHVV